MEIIYKKLGVLGNYISGFNQRTSSIIMTLPSLPRLLNKREALWSTTVFREWVLKKFDYSAIFEVKHTRGKEYLSFDEIKPHQVDKMLKIRHDKFLWKNPDTGQETPPDFFLLVKEPTFVVIKYPSVFVLIPIDIFLLEAKRSKRKSLTSSRAKDIATLTVACG